MIAMLIVLIAVGVLLALVPVEPRIRTAIVVITILLAVFVLLRYAGIA